jgi:hypothetical protein
MKYTHNTYKQFIKKTVHQKTIHQKNGNAHLISGVAAPERRTNGIQPDALVPLYSPMYFRLL